MDVVIGSGSIETLQSIVGEIQPYKIAVVTDSNVARFWLSTITSRVNAESLILSPGESTKNLENAIYLWKSLRGMGFTRKSLIIALGGGVISDLAGFVASTYMRGVSFVAIPTTLLAQVDAAIGGKTGINLEGKNIVGTFYLPRYVLIDPVFLSTLPEEEWLNGYGEMVKYAVLDREIYEMFMEKNRVDEEVIEKCARYKMRVVEKDLRENGIRMQLNLGHTLGHAIEKVTDYRIKHGIAVTYGLKFAARVAEKINGFDPDIVDRLVNKFLPLPDLHLEPQELLDAMLRDKKSWYGRITMVLPSDIGEIEIQEIEETLVSRVLEEMLC